MFGDDDSLRNARSKRASQLSSARNDGEKDAASADVHDITVVDEYPLGDCIGGDFHAESINEVTDGDVRKRATTVAGNKQSVVGLHNPLNG